MEKQRALKTLRTADRFFHKLKEKNFTTEEINCIGTLLFHWACQDYLRKEKQEK